MTYVGQGLPFVGDADVQATAVALGVLRAKASAGLRAIVECYRERAVDQDFLMCYGCLLRMLECSLSVEYLIATGRHRDAATLLITLVELRLDLQFAALDRSRVGVWLSHVDHGRKPWRIAMQIKSMFAGAEQEAELEVYKNLSMVKHANPASGPAGFPVPIDIDGLSIFHDCVGHNLSITYLFAAGSNIKDAFYAATRVLDSSGTSLAPCLHTIDTAMTRLSDVHVAYVQRALQALPLQGSRLADG